MSYFFQAIFLIMLVAGGAVPKTALAQSGALTSIEQPLETALEWAQKTGAPLLVITGQESCGACLALKRQLQHDETTRQILGDCVKLYLDCDSEDYHKWISRYRPSQNTLPQWFLVRADGQELINRSGNPQADQLNWILARQLEKAGKLINEQEFRQVQELVYQLQRQLDQDHLAQAARTAAAGLPVLRIAANSFAAPANTLRIQLSEIQRRLQAELVQLETGLETLKQLADSRKPAALTRIRERMDQLHGIPVIASSLQILQTKFRASAAEIYDLATIIDASEQAVGLSPMK